MKKTFDAVKFQREARKKISLEYIKNPEKFKNRLKEKFGIVVSNIKQQKNGR